MLQNPDGGDIQQCVRNDYAINGGMVEDKFFGPSGGGPANYTQWPTPRFTGRTFPTLSAFPATGARLA